MHLKLLQHNSTVQEMSSLNRAAYNRTTIVEECDATKINQETKAGIKKNQLYTKKQKL